MGKAITVEEIREWVNRDRPDVFEVVEEAAFTPKGVFHVVAKMTVDDPHNMLLSGLWHFETRPLCGTRGGDDEYPTLRRTPSQRICRICSEILEDLERATERYHERQDEWWLMTHGWDAIRALLSLRAV